MTPSSKVLRTWKPAARNTPTMRWLVGSTVAVKALMPACRAATARYSSSTVARPLPLCVVDEEGHFGLGPQRPAVVAGHGDHPVVARPTNAMRST